MKVPETSSVEIPVTAKDRAATVAMDTKPNAIRQRRFRDAHRRIDYSPNPDALRIIEWHCVKSGISLSSALDDLIEAGHAHITGNVSG